MEKNHKWGLKIDCTMRGISFAIFPLFFEHGNSHLQSFPALFSFFSLPNQQGINKFLFKKIKKGILNNIAAGTSLRGSAKYCITHDTHAAELTQLW